jgi:hypothetical protein
MTTFSMLVSFEHYTYTQQAATLTQSAHWVILQACCDCDHERSLSVSRGSACRLADIRHADEPGRISSVLSTEGSANYIHGTMLGRRR